MILKAKDFLRQLEKLDSMIQNKLIEQAQWQDMARSTTSFWGNERVQSSGGQEKMADAINRYLDMESEINQTIDKLIDAKKEVISVIEQLNHTEYDLLHKIYVQYNTLDKVAVMLDKSYSWVTTIHGRALKHVQDILDKKGME